MLSLPMYLAQIVILAASVGTSDDALNHEQSGTSSERKHAAVQTPTPVARAPLPVQSFKGPYAERARMILRQAVVRRRRPAEVFPCDPLLLEWLFKHPAWATELWRTMGVPISPLTPIEHGYECREESAVARLFEVHSEPGLRVVYCWGEARKPPLPGKLRAEMVIVQRYGFVKQPDSQYYMVQQLDAHAFAEGPALKAVMKLTKPACEQMVDYCLHDLTIYFALLARVMQLQPTWAMENIAAVRKLLPADEAAELSSIVARNPGRPNSTANVAATEPLRSALGPSAPEPVGLPTTTSDWPFKSNWSPIENSPIERPQAPTSSADASANREQPALRR